MLKNAKIAWVTGYKGFIGSNLVKSLIVETEKIGCIGRGVSNNENLNDNKLFKINGKITIENLNLLENQTSKPNIIYHLAGCSSVGKAESNIIESTLDSISAMTSLLEYCRNNAKKAVIILVSSPAVFGENIEYLNSELIHKPVSIYGMQKSLIEQICSYYIRKYILNIKIARVYSCYGEGLRKQFLWDLCNKLLSDEKVNLMGTGDEIRDFIHIDDLTSALRLFANSKIDFKYIEIGNGKGIKIKDAAKLISSNLSFFMKRKINKFQFSGQESSTNPLKMNANIQDLTKLGFKAKVSFEEGVKRYCKWFANLDLDNNNKNYFS